MATGARSVLAQRAPSPRRSSRELRVPGQTTHATWPRGRSRSAGAPPPSPHSDQEMFATRPRVASLSPSPTTHRRKELAPPSARPRKGFRVTGSPAVALPEISRPRPAGPPSSPARPHGPGKRPSFHRPRPLLRLHGAFWHYALKSGRQSSVVSDATASALRKMPNG